MISQREAFSGILLLAVLFATTKSFYVFYGAIAFFVIVLMVAQLDSLRFRFGRISGAVFIVFSLVFLGRSIYFSSVEDLKELLKVMLFVLMLWGSFYLKRRHIELIFSLFVLLNFGLALTQFLGFYGFGLQQISDHYNADKHIEASLSYSVPRALGFSSGPGQQSVVGLFFFSYFLVLYVWDGGRNRRIFFAALSLGIVLLSQSKTALIAFLIGSVGVALLILWKSNLRGRIFLIPLIILSGGVLYLGLEFFLGIFPEYTRLIEAGLGVSSLNDRYLNWAEMIKVFVNEQSVFFYLFGVGRSGLASYGVNELPFDSDYVYILVNFGILGLMLFLAMLAFVLIRGIGKFNANDLYGKFVVISFMYAVPAAITLNYFIEPRVFFLYAVVVSCFFWEKKIARLA